LNAADASALASLPGIGSTLAERIVQFRELNGPFASLDELADVAGMTQRRIDAIEPFVTLHEAP
jgi:competence protein ComEA